MCFFSKHHVGSILALLLVCQDLAADGIRCGRKLVHVGDSAGALIRACGAPAHKDRGRQTVSVQGVKKETNVERWYYKKNSRSLEHVVMIYQGKVVAVEVGSR
jgi:hypothetical protein